MFSKGTQELSSQISPNQHEMKNELCLNKKQFEGLDGSICCLNKDEYQTFYNTKFNNKAHIKNMSTISQKNENIVNTDVVETHDTRILYEDLNIMQIFTSPIWLKRSPELIINMVEERRSSYQLETDYANALLKFDTSIEDSYETNKKSQLTDNTENITESNAQRVSTEVVDEGVYLNEQNSNKTRSRESCDSVISFLSEDENLENNIRGKKSINANDRESDLISDVYSFPNEISENTFSKTFQEIKTAKKTVFDTVFEISNKNVVFEHFPELLENIDEYNTKEYNYSYRYNIN